MSTDTPEAPPVDRGDELLDAKPDAKLDTPPEAPQEPAITDSLDAGELEETEEERAEREAEERKRRVRVPKARLDEALAKARAREETLQRQIEELRDVKLRTQNDVAVAGLQTQIDELQDKYEDLLVDGDKDAARKVRRQLDAARDQLQDWRTSQKTEAARAAAVDELQYNARLATAEAQHPLLNPEHESFDAAKTDEVAVLLEAFVARGFARHAALEKAVQYVMGPPKTKGGTETAEVLAQQRAETARKRAADAMTRQPPSLSKVGLDNDKDGAGNAEGVDVARLSQAQFAKLDDATKARLRGDELA